METLLEDTEKLNKENKKLHQQLREAEETINLIKTKGIDALVSDDKKNLKVYTEKSGDKRYRILIEKMHEGAIILNKLGTILYCNSCFANMVNLPLQKVIGTPLNNFIEVSSKEQFEALIKEGWENYINNEILIVGKDGKSLAVLMSVNALSLETDFVLSIILTDLTIRNKNQEELKFRKKQLEQKNVEIESTHNELAFQNSEKEKRAAELSIANKELLFQNNEKEKRAAELNVAKTDVKELEELNTHKESVLATLSHDLRSPLSGIIGTAEHLKKSFDKLEPDKIKELLDLLYQASKEELTMLDSLVEWARVKHASEVFSPIKIELSQCIAKVFETLNENAVAKNIHLYNEIEKNTNVFADEKMLLSILQNIISNAIKHTPSEGKITITGKTDGDKIIVEIKDTGIGMTKEMQEKIFIPQFKSLSTERKENKGAGIGLLLAKGFVEKNGGKIWVESVVDKGSSFYFTLPLNKNLYKIESREKIEFENNDK